MGVEHRDEFRSGTSTTKWYLKGDYLGVCVEREHRAISD